MAEKKLTSTAHKLRRDMTDAERRLWSHLRARQMGVQFTRQFPIGDFIADFACRKLKLVVELDGGQHSGSASDIVRTQLIEAHGYRVVRFWNNEVFENLDGVLESIAAEIALARNEQIPLARNHTPPP